MASPPTYIAKNAKMQRMLVSAQRAANTPSGCFISGESSVGKSLLAKYIHDCSDRKEEEFIKVHCGSQSDQMTEDALFGYVKDLHQYDPEGAAGAIEKANGGTLLLSEVGRLPLQCQLRLKEVLQTGSVFRVGATESNPVSVRILATTSKFLEEKIAAGTYDRGFHTQVANWPFHIPALRERREDILPLANHFLGELNKATFKNTIIKYKTFTPHARASLQQAEWMGNISELRGAIKLAFELTSENKIRRTTVLEAIPDYTGGHSDLTGTNLDFGLKISFTKEIDALSKSLIKKALRTSGGVHVKAAKLLGITNPQTFEYKLDKYEFREFSRALRHKNKWTS